MDKKRVLSGMQTTGKLHLGNLLGALENWSSLQDEYDCFYFAADWHALSSNYEDTGELKENLLDLGINWLSAGLDPEKCTMFIQSLISEHARLHLYFSMIVPLPWLERVPTYKEKMEHVSRDLHTYGFLGYPVLQAADIVLYGADFVPVGIDQLPHLELTREIVRRFHDIYKTEVFVEPKPLLSEVPKLPGIDGRKMSKSYNNAIFLSDDEKSIREKVRNIITDPARVRKTDPGDPSKCVAYKFHEIFSDDTENEITRQECKTAMRGCVDCKKMLADKIVELMAPLTERRAHYADRPKDVIDILRTGSEKAEKIAGEKLAQVESAIGFDVKNFMNSF